jgi:hypothetical protein
MLITGCRRRKAPHRPAGFASPGLTSPQIRLHIGLSPSAGPSRSPEAAPVVDPFSRSPQSKQAERSFCLQRVKGSLVGHHPMGGGLHGGMADALVPVHEGVESFLHSAESGDGAAPAPRPGAANASSKASVELLVFLEQPLGGSIKIGGLVCQQITYGCSGQLSL